MHTCRDGLLGTSMHALMDSEPFIPLSNLTVLTICSISSANLLFTSDAKRWL